MQTNSYQRGNAIAGQRADIHRQRLAAPLADQPSKPGSPGTRGGGGVASLGAGLSVVLGLSSTSASSSGVVVLVGSGASVVSVGASDVGTAGLFDTGGIAGLRGPGWSVTTRPMVVPLPLPPTVPPLAHSKPVMTIMASRKAPSAPTAIAPHRSVANRRDRSGGCDSRTPSVRCPLPSGALTTGEWTRSILDLSGEV